MILASLLASLCFAADLPPVPGVLDPAVTQGNLARTVCAPGYTARRRHVTAATKAAIYRRDGRRQSRRCCEIDHVVPLELGGANDRNNVWAQRWREAHMKDQLENYLHREVCAGRIPLASAQKAIRTDWRAAWESMRARP